MTRDGGAVFCGIIDLNPYHVGIRITEGEFWNAAIAMPYITTYLYIVDRQAEGIALH